MAWVALDRTVRDAERFNLQAPLESWRKFRDRIHAMICGIGFDSERNTFTQSFGSSELDASLLLIPSLAFCRQTIHACAAPRRRSSGSS